MEAIETITQDGVTASLYYDHDAASPDHWDTLATFIHSTEFIFGEPISEPERGWPVCIRSLTLFGEAVAVLPVRVSDYGSSGLTMTESDAKNANGALYTTRKRVDELCGVSEEFHTEGFMLEALRSELEVWSQYAAGDVYGYVVEDSYGETVDSCWGFYGFEYAQGELARVLAEGVETVKERRAQVARGWATAHGMTPTVQA